MYAPVEVDRSLYVFGCNSVECTETPGSWRVLRDQVNADVATGTGAAAAADTTTTTVSAEPSRSAWDAGDDSDSSDWGDNSEGNEDSDSADPFASASAAADLIDLESLLLQRDDAMAAATTTTTSASKLPKPLASTNQNQHVSTGTGTAGPPLSASQSFGNVFPARPIEVTDEPFEDFVREHDYSHENALLADYMKQEDADKSTDVGDLRQLLSSAKKGHAGSKGASASSNESYEKAPAQQRHFLRFQKRISRCPLQCLRYDYGGEPLWPVPPPQRLQVPACVCGAARVFELQLTPTINYFLKVDAFARSIIPTVPAAALPAAAVVVSGSTPGSSGRADDHESGEEGNDDSNREGVARPPPPSKRDDPLSSPATGGKPMRAPAAGGALSAGGAMDWLSVVVYCCPRSCGHSREEFVFVLPAEKA